MTAHGLPLCVPPVDEEARAAARARQAHLLKPPGSLGRLEELAVELAGMTAGSLGGLERAAIVVFAGDHGIVARGVSAYPSEVTAQMLRSFLSGAAAIAVLARRLAVPLTVVDVGVAADTDVLLRDVPREGLVEARVRAGTRDFSTVAAMTGEEMVDALGVGRDAAEAAIASGAGLLVFGEMGIGNTTSAAALLAAMTGCTAEEATGLGAGVSPQGQAHKVGMVRAALALHRPDPADPLAALASVGGLEIAALVGAIVTAAAQRVPVVLDGFIVTTAAVVADALVPGCRAYLVAAHRSAERGHEIALRHLALRPLLDLEMRLGEASGAAVALPIVHAALALHRGMATFAEAGVSEGA